MIAILGGTLRALPDARSRSAGIAVFVAVLGLGFSAQAAIRAIIAHPAPQVGASAHPAGYEADDHFPGAAYFFTVDDSAAPAAGTTGTAELPEMPISALGADTVPDGTIHPARPFSFGRASAIDRGRALDCLTAAIYYEAAREPDAGQQAVAQVILNRVRHPAFPATVCGVVYQGSEHAGCQFSFACDGSMARRPEPGLWRRAMAVAASALAGQVYAPVGLATHYHTYAVTPAWNRQLVMTAAIGAHFFHRWQGWWGTPAAFSQGYRGGEPVPGPHPRAATLMPGAPAASPATIASLSSSPARATKSAIANTAPAAIQPAYTGSGTVQPRYAVPEADNGDSQILDKWKDSGKPLR
ncbi:cell wall hydrolase [Sphingomonas sp. GlSt437]